MKRVWIAVLAMVACFHLAAEIAPEHYESMQAAAPEGLVIVVENVDRDWCLWCSSREVFVVAKVEAVLRSQTQVVVGQSIEIRYTARDPDPDIAGPRPIPLLLEGVRYPAHLKKSGDGNFYEPAARGATFEEAVSMAAPIGTDAESDREGVEPEPEASSLQASEAGGLE